MLLEAFNLALELDGDARVALEAVAQDSFQRWLVKCGDEGKTIGFAGSDDPGKQAFPGDVVRFNV